MSAAAGSSAKIAIWTAIVTATTTVLTAFIGIVPALRHGDQQQIADLNTKVSALSFQLTSGAAGHKPKDTYVISGSVKTKKTNAPLSDAMLVIAAADNSQPLGDDGKFALRNMTNEPYYIVVQPQGGKLYRVLISPNDPDPRTDTDDLTITYNFSKE
jgi:hypothetical protein